MLNGTCGLNDDQCPQLQEALCHYDAVLPTVTDTITVTNTPDVLTDCTADIAMSLLLAVARRTGEGERRVRAGRWAGWKPSQTLGIKVTGNTLGLIGFGRIGQAVAKRAHCGFDMPVIFYTPHPPPTTLCDSLGATPKPSKAIYRTLP